MLDTDISSYVMKRSSPPLLKKLLTIPLGQISISAITKSELMYGVDISPRPQQDRSALDAYLDYVRVLDYPGEAADHYGKIRAELRRRGTIIGANDLLIAAHARSAGLILITNNTREFKRVPGLLLENWSKE
ncbi:MAG TPA: type II toxin-antitoxin system VapC family toxin [Acidobacteriaceae bacterium]|nr:type II toxin-antitoxin system VapC family toxin [Acidobacteriaceae bacterium]